MESVPVPYYDKGNIETWDFIIAKELNFLEGNVIKYIVRWKEKDGVKDLKKARTYINKLIAGVPTAKITNLVTVCGDAPAPGYSCNNLLCKVCFP